MAHSAFGPSKLEQRELCPGSYQMELGLAETETVNSARGSLLHKVIAECINAEYYGVDLNLARESLAALSDYDRAAVDFCLLHIATAYADYDTRFPKVHKQILIENQIKLGHVHPLIDQGTLDLAFILPESAHVFDWKFGTYAVTPAARNRQCQAYAAGIRHAYGSSAVKVTIVQPALNEVTSYLFTAEQIDGFKPQFIQIVTDCLKPDAVTSAGEKQCRHCKAAGICPTRANSVLNAIAVTPKTPHLPAVKYLTATQKAQILARKADIKRFLEAVEAAVMADLEAGLEVPGFELGEGRRSRAWADPDAAASDLTRVANELGKPPEDVLKVEVRSPAEIEAKWGKAKAVKAVLEKLIRYLPGPRRVVETQPLELEEGKAA